MKKNIIVAPLFAAMMLCSSLPVSAAEENRSSKITASIKPAWVVTIPLSVSVPFNATSTDFGTVALSEGQLEPGKCLVVSLQSDGKLENQEDTTKTIPYTIRNKADGNPFFEGRYTVSGDKTDLTIDIMQEDWNKAYAGEYEDTVIFHILYAADSGMGSGADSD